MGTVYEHYKPYRRTHQASAPGQPPASDIGNLASHITYSTSRRGLEGRVGTNVVYGKFLEFGTKNMAARPWLWPAYEARKRGVIQRLILHVRRALDQLAGM
jgi:HK97 gp10 family phage protein